MLWLLEELGLDYEVRHHQRDPRTMLAPPELRSVHPLGKAPVLVDGAVVVAESGAIVEYLVSRAGGALAPAPGTPEHLRYLHFLHYAEGSAMPPLLLRLVFDRIATTPVPFFVRPIVRRIVGTVDQSFITPQLKLHLDYLESELADTGLVRRRPLHRRRRADELPARGRCAARRPRRQPSAPVRLPAAHPCPAGLPARTRARRTVLVRRARRQSIAPT